MSIDRIVPLPIQALWLRQGFPMCWGSAFIEFNADPDPAFEIIADPDPGSQMQTNADPDLGHFFLSQKNEKYTLSSVSDGSALILDLGGQNDPQK